MEVSKLIDDLRSEVATLKEQLAVKDSLKKKEKIDWVEAQKLRDSGLTVREVAEIVGASHSAVGKYTKANK